MSYNRKIFYMNYYEGNEKKGNAGYVKVLVNGKVMEAELRLSGISALFDGERVWEIWEGAELLGKEEMLLQKGSSMQKIGWDTAGDLNSISFRVQLSEDCFLDSGRKEVSVPTKNIGTNLHVEEPILIGEEALTEEEEVQIWEEKVMESEILEEKREEAVKEEAVDNPVKEKVENRKWKQICKTYPHIQPFRDFREYIKLDLKDMVLISEKKYSLVENSFLLHGYYNYGHLILWRKDKAPIKYYIGVPGNFYEKEKQVAVLYGFESFEGAVEPAGEGDFGYYMTEVTI